MTAMVHFSVSSNFLIGHICIKVTLIKKFLAQLNQAAALCDEDGSPATSYRVKHVANILPTSAV